MDTRPCPQCSASVEASHQFCPHCGFPIAKVVKEGDDPLVGRTLPGGFLMLELVGIGGMGRVYRAEQTNLGRTVAVKIIHPHLVGEESAAARFITEARAASSLNHPNSVSVFDFGKAETGELYLVMEFLRGKDLSRVCYEEGLLPFTRIVRALIQVLAALAEAHHLGIIHRDLKPENIILEKVRQGGTDFVKVVDFGLAKMLQTKPTKGITQAGIVCGTPEYMSPEQGRGDAIDQRSDLYAVGVIFYQLLTGVLPFEADAPTQVVLMHITRPVPEIHGMAPADRKIPQPFVDVCMMALAKDPNHRFSTADEFSQALADALSQVEAAARPVRAAAPVDLDVECPRCQAKNPASKKFCGECGGPIGVLGMSVPAHEAIPSPAPVRPSYTARSEHIFPLPLTHRHNELGWLRTFLNAHTSSMRALCVVGDAGAGKTRLAMDLIAEELRTGAVIALGKPDPYFAAVGFYTLREVIAQLAPTSLYLASDADKAKHLAGVTAEALRGLTELFAPERALSQAPTASLSDRRFDTAEALRWAIGDAEMRSSGARILIVIDDVDGIDASSRRAIFDVIGTPKFATATLILTHQPDFTPESPTPLPTCLLSALPEADILPLLIGAGVIAEVPFGRTRAATPLYVEQFIRFCGERGTAPPTGLADLIAARIERLDPDARRVLQALAVFGNNTGIATLQTMIGGTTQVEQGIAALDKAAMVLATDGRLSISHPRIRDIALAAIPSAVRQTLHAAAAEVGEADDLPIEALALHQYAAQNAFKALILLEQVATRRTRRGDTDGASQALQRGLELARLEMFRGRIDEPERAVVLFGRKLGEALFKLRKLTDADGVLREALDVPGAPGAERARAFAVLAQVSLARGKRADAAKALHDAKEWAERAEAHDVLFIVEGLERSVASA